MRTAFVLTLFLSLICLQNAQVAGRNSSDLLLGDAGEWGLLEGILEALIQKQDEFSSSIRKPNTEDDDISDDGEWVMKVKGGLGNALRIANETRITLKRQVRGFEDYYVFEHQNPTGSRSKRSSGELLRHIRELQQVVWVEHQRERRRTKRANFNDPLWRSQWELKRETPAHPGSLRIPETWSLGYTGTGIVVSVLDDGVDHAHPDLQPNYEPRASYDLNGNDNDPMPTKNDNNKHGTRCAGEIAMVANNSVCGVGVAFNSKIAGVRMLDGVITDRLEMEALTTGLGLVDVYSSSWGPSDDGETVEGPGRLATMGILKGIREGRKGKGVIYVWASGNGGSAGDDCSCDGYSSSIYTFSVSAATEDGSAPWYAEECPSTLVATYSSGSNKEQMITTTDTNGKCTNEHSGTSAAAPLAAGIVALGLEANPSLTWRDVQHLAVWTSNPAPVFKDGGDWHMNGVGLLISNQFGFGLMDSFNFVSTSKNWKNVPQQKICSVILPNFVKRTVNSMIDTAITFSVDACRGMPNQVNFIEHIQLVVDISHTKRGNLEIYLVSPMGTKTRLLKSRRNDDSRSGFRSWPFTSLHTWGENPQGNWEVHVIDTGNPRRPSSGTVNNISLVIFGTTERPAHYSQNRSYPGIDLNKLKNQKRAPMMNIQNFSQRFSEAGPGIISRRSTDILAESAAVLDELNRNPRFSEDVQKNPQSLDPLLTQLIQSKQRNLKLKTRD